MNKELAEFVVSTEPNGGFLTFTDLQFLKRIDPCCPVVIRFGCSPRLRVLVSHVDGQIASCDSRGDYVRDIFFTAEQMDEAKLCLSESSNAP